MLNGVMHMLMKGLVP